MVHLKAFFYEDFELNPLFLFIYHCSIWCAFLLKDARSIHQIYLYVKLKVCQYLDEFPLFNSYFECSSLSMERSIAFHFLLCSLLCFFDYFRWFAYEFIHHLRSPPVFQCFLYIQYFFMLLVFFLLKKRLEHARLDLQACWLIFHFFCIVYLTDFDQKFDLRNFWSQPI